MSDDLSTDRPLVKRPPELSRILEEMRAAVRQALARSKRLGNPVVVWREGRVVWLPPEQTPGPGSSNDRPVRLDTAAAPEEQTEP